MTEHFELPSFVDVNGEWEDVCSRLYSVFSNTFKPAPLPYLFGKPVAFDKRCLSSDGLEEGFWHVISRNEKGKRIFDPERSRRLSWIDPMLNVKLPQLLRFKYEEGDGTVKYYLWLKEEKYVVIFAERKNVMILVTAFYIDKTWLENDLEKRIKKGTTF